MAAAASGASFGIAGNVGLVHLHARALQVGRLRREHVAMAIVSASKSA